VGTAGAAKRVADDRDYTALSLADVAAGLDDLTREVPAAFGALDASRLN
jgi:hypothetical protein